MIIEEFQHYFRICMGRTITGEEARLYLFAVNDHADVEADAEDVVMVYHLDEETGAHCYDVRLSKDITGEQGDQIIAGLEEIFPTDDFTAESSMDSVSENQYLNQAILVKLGEKLV
jgi:hypothetical protein